MARVVDLENMAQLQRAFNQLDIRMQKALRAATWTTARWGAAKAATVTVGKKISASNTFAGSWLARPVSDGSMIANSARHAYFVERGRRVGRMPPVAAIEEWIKLKHISPRADAPPKANRVTGDITSGSQRTRLKRIASRQARFNRSETARGYKQRLAIKAMALAIARKIGRRGTRGRFILGSLMRAIGMRFRSNIRYELSRITASPPR